MWENIAVTKSCCWPVSGPPAPRPTAAAFGPVLAALCAPQSASHCRSSVFSAAHRTFTGNAGSEAIGHFQRDRRVLKPELPAGSLSALSTGQIPWRGVEPRGDSMRRYFACGVHRLVGLPEGNSEGIEARQTDDARSTPGLTDLSVLSPSQAALLGVRTLGERELGPVPAKLRRHSAPRHASEGLHAPRRHLPASVLPAANDDNSTLCAETPRRSSAGQHGGPAIRPELALQRPDKCAPPARPPDIMRPGIMSKMTIPKKRSHADPSPPPGIPRCQPHLQRRCPGALAVSVVVAED